MKNTLTLTKKQSRFLEENRQDPITGDSFQLGDKVVFCAECKSAFLKESWEYMDNKHCKQSKTLRKIPKNKRLALKKIDKTNYQIPSRTDLVTSWGIDTVIWGIIVFLVTYFLASNDYLNDYFGIIIAVTLLLKDNTLIFTSVGKKLRKISIIYLTTSKKANPLLYPLRHIFSMILVILFLNKNINSLRGFLAIFCCICLLDLLINFETGKRIMDYVLGIRTIKNDSLEEV